MAAAQADAAAHHKRQRVVCYGSICMDQLVLLDEHPEPNAKVLTRGNEFLGGGNAGNVATCIARLSASVTGRLSRPVDALLVSKVGTDTYGGLLVDELRRDGVCLEHLIVKEGVTTPTTVVLVTEKEQSRTCLHTAISEFMQEDELDIESLLPDNATQLFLDSRHPQAGIALGQAAVKRGNEVVVDMEKVREGTERMLSLATHLNTSSHFPAQYTGEECLLSAAAKIFAKHPNIRRLTVTLGTSGSVMLSPYLGVDGLPSVPSLDSVMLSRPTRIQQPQTFSCAGVRVVYCPAFDCGELVLDTTGCGDAFLGALLFVGLQEPQLEAGEALRFASVVASLKTRQVGAKTALPTVGTAAEACEQWRRQGSK